MHSDFSNTGLTLHEDYPEEVADYGSPAYWIQVSAVSPVAPGVCDIGTVTVWFSIQGAPPQKKKKKKKKKKNGQPMWPKFDQKFTDTMWQGIFLEVKWYQNIPIRLSGCRLAGICRWIASVIDVIFFFLGGEQ